MDYPSKILDSRTKEELLDSRRNQIQNVLFSLELDDPKTEKIINRTFDALFGKVVQNPDMSGFYQTLYPIEPEKGSYKE